MDFIVDKPALVIGKKLVISDLHLGIESMVRGLNIGSQTKKMAEETVRLLKENNCDKLLIVGDLKESITVRPGLEDVFQYVNEVKKHAEITLVQGNHDGALQEYLDINVFGGRGFKDGKYYFVHGHAEPEEEARRCFIISSHFHPVVEFNDSLGGRLIEKVWLKSPKALIMPSFNPLIGGTDVRESDFGVMKKWIDVNKLDIYLLDGLQLGRIKDLPRLEKHERNKASNSRKKRPKAH